jgi:hypothetical protein
MCTNSGAEFSILKDLHAKTIPPGGMKKTLIIFSFAAIQGGYSSTAPRGLVLHFARERSTAGVVQEIEF